MLIMDFHGKEEGTRIHKLKCTLLWPIMVVAVSVCVIAAVVAGSIKWAFNRDEDEFI